MSKLRDFDDQLIQVEKQIEILEGMRELLFIRHDKEESKNTEFLEQIHKCDYELDELEFMRERLLERIDKECMYSLASSILRVS